MFMVKCTWPPAKPIYIGPFSARDSAEDFASDPRSSRYRSHIRAATAAHLFESYEREVVEVLAP